MAEDERRPWRPSDFMKVFSIGTKTFREEMLMLLVKCIFVTQIMKDDAAPIEVIPGVFIGSVAAALNDKALLEAGITHILCVASGIKSVHPDKFTYRVYDVKDAAEEQLATYFDEAVSFIDEAVVAGHGCLVHCFAGKSRSSTFICAYLMKRHHLPLPAALDLIRSKRPTVQPNPGFIAQLLAYGRDLGLPLVDEVATRLVAEAEAALAVATGAAGSGGGGVPADDGVAAGGEPSGDASPDSS